MTGAEHMLRWRVLAEEQRPIHLVLFSPASVRGWYVAEDVRSREKGPCLPMDVAYNSHWTLHMHNVAFTHQHFFCLLTYLP